MKTTKKDVAEEGLLFKKTVSSNTEDSLQDDLLTASNDVVDVSDVQISLPGSYNHTMVQPKPVQMVSPLHKPARTNSLTPPTRPARTDKLRNHNNSEAPPSITTSILPPGHTSPKLWPNNNNNNNSGSEPINIHVSVTINPPAPPIGGSSGGPPYSTGTLADLKRSRSQNRVSSSSRKRNC